MTEFAVAPNVITLQQLVQALSESETLDFNLIDGATEAPGLVLQSFSTDTRTLRSGDVFIALKGPNHDAHEHLQTAIGAGAKVLVVEKELTVAGMVPQLVVEDTRLALGAIAAVWCQLHKAKRVAITGSNGKTTVKEMVASILEAATRRSISAAPAESAVLATQGNLNNDIGLPLTCLSLRPQHCYAVLEMGANAAGEIAYLSNLAKPDVALVNSVAEAHLEGFGSVDTVAVEKASIYSGLSAEGCAVMPEKLLDDAKFATVLQGASAHCRKLTFGFSQTADVCGSLSRDSSSGEVTEVSIAVNKNTENCSLAGSRFSFELGLPGMHNHLNALAAIALCCNFDVTADDIAAGLSSMQAVPGRLQLRTGVSPARVIDDTYNANPASVRAAIDVLASYGGKRVLVLGDMKELGSAEMQMHAEAGRYAREQGIDCLITIGALAAHAAGEFGENAASFTDKKDIAWLLREKLGAQHTVLFKGSRGARMEEIIELLQQLGKGSGSSAGGGGLVDGVSGDAAAVTGSLHSNCLEEPPSNASEAIFRQRLSRRVVSL